MSVSISRISPGLFVSLFATRRFAATFGMVVPTRGMVSDIALVTIDATVPDHVEEGTSVPLTITQQTQSTTLSVRVVNP